MSSSERGHRWESGLRSLPVEKEGEGTAGMYWWGEQRKGGADGGVNEWKG